MIITQAFLSDVALRTPDTIQVHLPAGCGAPGWLRYVPRGETERGPRRMSGDPLPVSPRLLPPYLPGQQPGARLYQLSHPVTLCRCCCVRGAACLWLKQGISCMRRQAWMRREQKWPILVVELSTCVSLTAVAVRIQMCTELLARFDLAAFVPISRRQVEFRSIQRSNTSA